VCSGENAFLPDGIHFHLRLAIGGTRSEFQGHDLGGGHGKWFAGFCENRTGWAIQQTQPEGTVLAH